MDVAGVKVSTTPKLKFRKKSPRGIQEEVSARLAKINEAREQQKEFHDLKMKNEEELHNMKMKNDQEMHLADMKIKNMQLQKLALEIKCLERTMAED